MNAKTYLLFMMIPVAAACGSKWDFEDGDGDGISAAEGDCWDKAEGPVGALPYPPPPSTLGFRESARAQARARVRRVTDFPFSPSKITQTKLYNFLFSGLK